MEYSKYIYAILVILVISYASLAKYDLSNNVANLFHNTFFRLIAITLIAYIAVYDIKVAIVVSIGYAITYILLSKYEFTENFRNVPMFQLNHHSEPIPLSYHDNKPLNDEAPNGLHRCDPQNYDDYPNEKRYYNGPGCESYSSLSSEYKY